MTVPESTGSIVFDGDDTLWETQELYEQAKRRFFALLDELGHDRNEVAERFAEIDIANVARLGLSKERFPASMRETYEFFCDANGGQAQTDVTETVLSIGKAVFDSMALLWRLTFASTCSVWRRSLPTTRRSRMSRVRHLQ